MLVIHSKNDRLALMSLLVIHYKNDQLALMSPLVIHSKNDQLPLMSPLVIHYVKLAMVCSPAGAGNSINHWTNCILMSSPNIIIISFIINQQKPWAHTLLNYCLSQPQKLTRTHLEWENFMNGLEKIEWTFKWAGWPAQTPYFGHFN